MAAGQHSLRVALGSPLAATAARGGSVLLQQEAWDPYVGHLTKMQVFAWLSKIIFQTAAPAGFCPPDAPGFAKTIYAFPSPASLNFKIGCSNGNLTPGLVEILDYTELVQVNLSRNPPLKYPAMSISSYAWDGDVYNKKGEMVGPPDILLINNSLNLRQEVYGSLRVTYKVYRNTYTLSVQPREEYQEKNFQSFIYAVWGGGTTYIEVEAPVGSEQEEVPCNNILGGGINGGLGQFGVLGATPGSTTGGELETEDDPYQGQVSGSDENRYIDYCTQKEI